MLLELVCRWSMRDAFSSPEDAKSFSNEQVRKISKSGGSVKWLSKLLPSFRGKSKSNLAVVAPAPDAEFDCDLFGQAETNTARSVAWQAASYPHVVANSDETQDPAKPDAVADSKSSQVFGPANEAPAPVASALARSSAISAALIAESEATEPQTQQVLTWQEWKETCRREGEEPLPIELFDEPKGLVVKPIDADMETLLPPLPAQSHDRSTDENLPGVASDPMPHDAASELELVVREISHRDSESLQVRRRRSSYRSTVTLSPTRLTPETLASPRKIHGAPQRVCSLSSRPTTAGEDISLPRPASHQSTSSTSWPDQSAAGYAVPNFNERAPPSLRNAALSAGSKSPREPFRRPESSMGRVQNDAPMPPPPPPPPPPPSQPPPPAQPGDMDASIGRSANNPMLVAALMRACDSANARTAAPPDINRRKHLLELAQRAREEEDNIFLDDEPTEVKSVGRQSSKDSVARKFDKPPQFSELAVSFASLNDDM